MLSANDRRVLANVGNANRNGWDGYVPHGSGDWSAIRRLCAAGLVAELDELGVCCECDSVAHNERETWVRLFVTTDAGKALTTEGGE